MVKNKKLLFIPLLALIIVTSSCVSFVSETTMYTEAFEEILFENGAYLDEVDYISIFINEDGVPDNLLLNIQESLKQKHHKKVYTYKKEEVHISGPYGKESLEDDGIFLYIIDIDIKEGIMYITGEKHYTNKNHPSVITTFTKDV